MISLEVGLVSFRFVFPLTQARTDALLLAPSISEWVNTTTVVLNGTLVEFYDLVSTTGEAFSASVFF